MANIPTSETLVLMFNKPKDAQELMLTTWTLIFGEFETDKRGSFIVQAKNGDRTIIYHPNKNIRTMLMRSIKNRYYQNWSKERISAARLASESVIFGK